MAVNKTGKIEDYHFVNSASRVIKDFCSFKWTVDDFSNLKLRVGHYIQSEYCPLSNRDIKVCVQLFPNGVEEKEKDFVGLAVQFSLSNYYIMKIDVHMGFLDKLDRVLFKHNWIMTSPRAGSFRFFRKDALLAEKELQGRE